MGVTRKRFETYSRYKGKKIAIVGRTDLIYNGGVTNQTTKKREYEFICKNESGEQVGRLLVDFKTFKRMIKEYEILRIIES